MSRAIATAASASWITSRWPGTVETPASCASRFDCDLVAHRGDRRRAGPDEATPAFGKRRREGRLLRQKAVAGMHRLGAGFAAGLDDPLDAQIALGRRRRADRHRLVGLAHMQRLGIGIGIDRDGRDPHPPRRSDDPAGDLAAIGDQDFVEHLNVPRLDRSSPRLVTAEYCRASSRGFRAACRAAWRARGTAAAGCRAA